MTQLLQQFTNLLYQSQECNQDNLITSFYELSCQLIEQVEANLKFFTSRFDQILVLYNQLIANYQAEGATVAICFSIFEIFVLMVERRPILITKNQTRLLSMFQGLYQTCSMIDFQCDELWMKPPEGHSDENDFSDDQTLSKQIMCYTDRIANAYTYPKFVEFFTEILDSWWPNSQGNWKARYTLLLFISQLGENIQLTITMKPFFDCAKISVAHEHPKVRYATLQMLGQFSEDLKPDFQKIYGQQFFPLILGCTNDEVPRIQGHAMACLTNFLQGFEHGNFHILKPYVNEILNIAQNFCENGISHIKENTISSLTSLSGARVLTDSQSQRILAILNNLLMNEKHKAPEYNQLMGQTIQCLSMTVYAQKKQTGSKYLDQIVTLLKQMKERIDSSYFLTSWSRLCSKYQNFTDLSQIFPEILSEVNSMLDQFDDQTEAGFKAIRNTISAFQQSIKPYSKQIFSMCKVSFDQSDFTNPSFKNMKSLIFGILTDLIIKLNSQAPDPEHQNFSKQVFTYIFEKTKAMTEFFENQESQIDSNNQLLEGLNALNQCVAFVAKHFTTQNVQLFAIQIFNFSNKITYQIKRLKEEIETENKLLKQTQDQLDQEDVNEAIQSDTDKLQKLIQARFGIPDIFESLFKVIPRMNAMSIIESLYPHVSGFLQNVLEYNDIRYGLYFLCNFLTGLGFQGIANYSHIYQSKFEQFSLSNNIQVRNCAVFGLGEFMSMIPPEKTDETTIYKWLNILWNSLSISVDQNTKKKQYNFAKDNIVSALGKLLNAKRMYYPSALNKQVHRKWFENLPLNHDKVEGNIQHQILLNFLVQSPETFITSKEDVFQLLKVFANYFTKRLHRTEEIIAKNRLATKSFLFNMKDWPIFQENSDFLWNSLSPNCQEILTQLMSAP